jgi:dihydroflavonol-4-reductase
MTNEEIVGVTGATGFVAGHVIRELLERGVRVRATVRSLAKADKTAHLTTLPGADERLRLFEADLLEPESFDEALSGCTCVMHTASPYVLDVADVHEDLVKPAVEGTLGVLRACTKIEGLRRVVLTSSMAAISDEPVPDHVFTEDDWNEKSSPTRNPYYYSKTEAERAAWSFVKEHPELDLVVINPYMIIGPSLGPALNTSNQIFRDVLTGVYPGIMSLAWGFVDVRDVALAHVAAMQTPDASGRYLCAGETMSMREVVDLLRENGYERYALPRRDLACSIGDFAVRLMSYTQPKGVGTYMRTHIGKVMQFDNAKIRRDLGLEFRPSATSVLDTCADLRRWGHLPPS